MNKLIIDIPYQQKIEIIIEFPLSVLDEYNGINNIDETWDENIMPVATTALLNCGFHLKSLQIENSIENNKFLWFVSLVVNPPSVNLSCIVNNLAETNFQKGLLIKVKKEHEDFKTLYCDSYYS
jgi:hypothetical protein